MKTKHAFRALALATVSSFAAGADGLPSSPTRGRLEMRLSAGPMPIR